MYIHVYSLPVPRAIYDFLLFQALPLVRALWPVSSVGYLRSSLLARCSLVSRFFDIMCEQRLEWCAEK